MKWLYTRTRDGYAYYADSSKGKQSGTKKLQTKNSWKDRDLIPLEDQILPIIMHGDHDVRQS